MIMNIEIRIEKDNVCKEQNLVNTILQLIAEHLDCATEDLLNKVPSGLGYTTRMSGVSTITTIKN